MTDETDPPVSTKWHRRRALWAIAGAGVALWWGWPRLAPYLVGAFDFEPIDDPQGFRRIAGGQTSGFPSPFVGLETKEATDTAAIATQVRADLCQALFGAKPARGVVPVASFSDYYCPYCRVLTQKLATLEERAQGRLSVNWHEWPLLGPSSALTARAALAADMQGAYATFHRHLMRARLIPTVRYLETMAESAGLDPVRFRMDMQSTAVALRLQRTAAIAEIFGFIGTPALVVGRTVVVGALSEAKLAALIAKERQDGSIPACST